MEEGRTSHYIVIRHLHTEVTHRETGRNIAALQYTHTQEGINTPRDDFIEFHPNAYIHSCTSIYTNYNIEYLFSPWKIYVFRTGHLRKFHAGGRIHSISVITCAANQPCLSSPEQKDMFSFSIAQRTRDEFCSGLFDLKRICDCSAFVLIWNDATAHKLFLFDDQQ